MLHQARTTALLAVALLVRGASASAQAFEDLGVRDIGEVADSLEARVWLDRGDEPVVKVGDEVRVYYRTSADAYAAIFRIDTDGRIEMVFPQHPDVDPYVGGGRDYRLLFPDSPRWRVRDDPGMGYFFMIASPEPLDFSAFGYDAEGGWDLTGVGETIYEDPYVAIDHYVAAVLPRWDVTPHALDFLSYSVGEAHEYPRFLCYDCHEQRSYARWNPYDYTCSSFQVVVWNDPYFLPRYRYVGTRVVFARPFGPRPRYTVVGRVDGDVRRTVVRARPAPPARVVGYKEDARRAPLRRPSALVPDRSRGGAPAPAVRAPDRADSGRPGSALRRSLPAERGGVGSVVPRSREGVSSGREAPARAERSAPARAERGRSATPPSRALPPRGSAPRAEAQRPSLQRRSPSAAPARAAPSRGSPPAASSRPPVIRTPPRGASSRPPPRASAGRPPPSAAPDRDGPPRASPPPTTRPQGSAGPARPGGRAPARAPTRRPRRPGG